METAMNVGVRPIDRPQSAGGTEGVSRRGDGGSSSAAFSPKTNVSIQSAVDDMAGILAKISSNQSEAVDKMPQDLQKVIQNVLKQAFSLEETMGQGLGSTLESQRFSMDQLSALSRMLSQLGAMAEKGMPVEVSDEMRALLSNLKALVTTENGGALEPVLLTKAAFELLDNKSFTELPKEVQALLLTLQPQGQAAAMQADEGSSMGFLKQLVQYFMPRPASGEAPANQPQSQQGQNAPQGQAAPNGQQAGGAPQQASQNAQAGQPQAQGQPANQPQAQQGQQAANQPQGQNAPQGQAAPNGQQAGGAPQQAGQNAQTGQPQAQGQPANQSQAQQGQQAANQPQGQNAPQGQAAPNGQQADGAPQQAGQNAQTGQPQAQGQPANQPQAQQGQQAANQSQGQNAPQGQAAPNGQQAGGAPQQANQNAQTGQPQSQQAAMQQAKAQLMSQTMENTQQAMNTMKSLAQLLLKNAEMSQKDLTLLQNFVNGQSSTLSDKDAKQLQQLIRLCQQNVPATVQQAAVQQNLPDLPRLWAFMQLCDMTFAKRMTARQLKRAGKDVALLVLSMRNAMGGDNSSVQGQRSLNFMLPMYMGEESTYPSYIHVYDEKQPDPETGEMKKETWLRLCVLTDNIGAVELTCRVFNETELDLRVFFSNPESAAEFREQAKALRESLKDSALKLNDLKIGAAGERRFM